MSRSDLRRRRHVGSGGARRGTAAAVPASRRRAGAAAASGSICWRSVSGDRADHPGWGNSSLPDWLSTVDDLAYLYLDLAATLGLEDAVLVGACFGGWIAAEMAVRDTRRFAQLVLVDPLGIKVRRRAPSATSPTCMRSRATSIMRLAWADPAQGRARPDADAGDGTRRHRARPRGVRACSAGSPTCTTRV